MKQLQHKMGVFGLALAALIAASTTCAAEPPAGVYYWEPARIAEAKAKLKAGADDPELVDAVERVREEANDCLRRGPYAVTDNNALPPSGDKHDYISYAVYWWPNPKTKDGLPFVRRDGHTNKKQRAKGDRDALEHMIEDLEALSLGHYFLGRDDYGEHARQLVRTWFLDGDTKMNPNLTSAQAVPGRKEGRGAGIIDARAFVELLDSIALLEDTGALTAADQKALRQWFADYLKWMLTSEYGEHERHAENNHGTWYLAQAARVALYVDDKDTAKKLVEEGRARLADTVQADGSQQEELERTRSLHYSLFHLTAFAYLARFGEALGVDLWQDASGGVPRIQRGLDFAAPFVLKQDSWPYEEIRDYELTPQTVQLLRMAEARYRQPSYGEVLEKAERSDADRDFSALLFAGAK